MWITAGVVGCSIVAVCWATLVYVDRAGALGTKHWHRLLGAIPGLVLCSLTIAALLQQVMFLNLAAIIWIPLTVMGFYFGFKMIRGTLFASQAEANNTLKWLSGGQR